MLLTPHSLIGASIGVSTNNIPLIIILGILSHYLLDALPHFDWGTWHNYEPDFKLETKDYILVFFDIIITVLLTIWIWNHKDRNHLILIGVFFAILPDLIDNVPFWKHIVRKTWLGKFTHKIHTKVHYYLKPKYWYWGIITQLVIIGGCLYYLVIS